MTHVVTGSFQESGREESDKSRIRRPSGGDLSAYECESRSACFSCSLPCATMSRAAGPSNSCTQRQIKEGERLLVSYSLSSYYTDTHKSITVTAETSRVT